MCGECGDASFAAGLRWYRPRQDVARAGRVDVTNNNNNTAAILHIVFSQVIIDLILIKIRLILVWLRLEVTTQTLETSASTSAFWSLVFFCSRIK